MGYKSRKNWRLGMCLPSCQCIQCRKKELSSCCKYPVKVKGKVTCYYVCLKCNQPCNLNIGETNEK